MERQGWVLKVAFVFVSYNNELLFLIIMTHLVGKKEKAVILFHYCSAISEHKVSPHGSLNSRDPY